MSGVLGAHPSALPLAVWLSLAHLAGVASGKPTGEFGGAAGGAVRAGSTLAATAVGTLAGCGWGWVLSTRAAERGGEQGRELRDAWVVCGIAACPGVLAQGSLPVRSALTQAAEGAALLVRSLCEWISHS